MNIHEWVEKNPDVMSGAVVFKNTRVPVAVVFDNLADGLSVHEILESYPTVSKEAVLAVLAIAQNNILSQIKQE